MSKKPLKILIATGIFPPDIGGPATYSKLLLEELPARGFTPVVYSFGSVRHYPKIIRHFVYFFGVCRRALKTDLIYAQDPVSVGLPVMFASRLMAKPYLLKIVGDYAWEQGSQRFGVTDFLDEFSKQLIGYRWPVRGLKKIQTIVAKNAREIIVPSKYLKKIVGNWGVNTGKISVIYNAFEGKIKEDFNRQIFREKNNWSGQVVISVGRLVPWKGFAELISWWEEVKNEFPQAKLLIVGDGPDRKRLEALIAELNLSSVVKLTGRLSQADLFDYLRGADIFALNTSYEGFSHQLLEVMALGTPIITTKVGGNPELIQDGWNGILVPFSDKEAWLRALRKLLANDIEREALSSAGLATVERFTRDIMLDQLSIILRHYENN